MQTEEMSLEHFTRTRSTFGEFLVLLAAEMKMYANQREQLDASDKTDCAEKVCKCCHEFLKTSLQQCHDP